MITLFPEMFGPVLEASILGRARRDGRVHIGVHNLRDWADDPHRRVDDAPYGGGPGMVLKPEPLFAAVDALRRDDGTVIALTPGGRRLDRELVVELAARPHLLLLCGRYEGFDQRVLDRDVDLELSIGDYVLTGGELPAMVLIDAVARRLPGVVGHSAGVGDDSFEQGLLEAPRYTRPPEIEGRQVPKVLLSGDHGAVEGWRLRKALERTLARRPDLLAGRELPEEWIRLVPGLASRGDSQ